MPIISRSTFVAILYVFAFALGISLALPQAASARGKECGGLFESNEGAEALLVSGFRLRTVEIEGRVVFYEHFPAKRGKGTVLLFTGLHTPQREFFDFKKAFAAKSRGEGLIVMSYSTMPDSMVFLETPQVRELAKKDLTITDYAREATAVINAAEVRGPVSVVGYSYGSAPASVFAAFHRERIANFVLVTPLVFNGENHPGAVSGLAALKMMSSFNPFFGGYVVAAVKDQSAKWLAGMVIDLKWSGTLPREAVVAGLVSRVRSTDDFDLRTQGSTRWPRTHFILAEKEDTARLQAQNEAFATFTEAARGDKDRQPTMTIVKEGDHRLLQEQADDSATLILEIMRRR